MSLLAAELAGLSGLVEGNMEQGLIKTHRGIWSWATLTSDAPWEFEVVSDVPRECVSRAP